MLYVTSYKVQDSMKLGYTKPLYILPFDHRASFLKKMFGIENRQPTDQETKTVADFKAVIYEGFKLAVDNGSVPKEYAAILIDEQFGDAIITDAVRSGYTVCLATEKSGQDEFDFEYGEQFAVHIDKYKPKIVKALVRYNPEDDPALNARQREKLKQLSDFCHGNGYKFIIEPLIPATPKQLASVGNDEKRYDHEIRPALAVAMVEQLQTGGVEPDIWKIEGLAAAADYQAIIKQIKSGGRDKASVIILGRGADDGQVEAWLKAGSGVEGVIGFAVGRTIFWQALVEYKEGNLSREQAVEQIAKKYIHFYDVFTS